MAKFVGTKIYYENSTPEICEQAGNPFGVTGTNADILVNRGGGGSGKTHSIMQVLVSKWLSEPAKNILIIRKTLPSLKTSTWSYFHKVLHQVGLQVSDFRQEKQMMNFYYGFKTEQSLLHFSGLDDPEKIKCLTPETEVLSDKGFIPVKDAVKGTKLATMNPKTREVEYQPVSHYYVYDYDGDIYSPKANKKYSYLSFAVTEEHKILASTRKHTSNGYEKQPLEFIKARDLDVKKRWYIPRTGKWSGKKVEYYEIPKIDYSENKKWDGIRQGRKTTKFEINNFLSLLGWFLSEGNISSKYEICITQTKKQGREKLEEVLNNFPYCYSECNGDYKIAGKDLVSFMKQFGKCYDKFIPRDILELHPDHLWYLFNSLIDGDGTREGKNRYTYSTTSEQLKDDMCELSIKLGMTPTVQKRKPKYPSNYPNGSDYWTINITKRDDTLLTDIKKEHYKGKVYCFTVEPYNNVMIRHNGRVQWIGQSAEWNYIWMEEATDFTYKDFKTLYLYLRNASKDGKPNQMFLSFNPVDENHWIKKKIIDNPEYKSIKEIVSTYQDNPYLPKTQIKRLEALATQDRNFHRVYCLGEWGRLDHIIYNNWDIYPRKMVNPELISETIYGVDWGYSTSKSAVIQIDISNEDPGDYEGVCFERELVYSDGLTTSDLIREMKLKIPVHKRTCPFYCDSAEPDRVEQLLRAGFNAIPMKKNKGSVLSSIDMVKRWKTWIMPDSENLIREKNSFSWAVDRNDRVLPEPVKWDDHLMDAEKGALYTHFDGAGEVRIRWF